LTRFRQRYFFAVVRDGLAPVSLGRDDSFAFGVRQLFTDGVGVIALVCQRRLDLVGDDAEQRAEALDIVGLPCVRTKPSGRPFA
jgi:hypothetical protein